MKISIRIGGIPFEFQPARSSVTVNAAIEALRRDSVARMKGAFPGADVYLLAAPDTGVEVEGADAATKATVESVFNTSLTKTRFLASGGFFGR